MDEDEIGLALIFGGQIELFVEWKRSDSAFGPVQYRRVSEMVSGAGLSSGIGAGLVKGNWNRSWREIVLCEKGCGLWWSEKLSFGG